jgi:hypothetical protein
MQVCGEVPVIEPLLKSVNGVRVHRGWYEIDVRLDVLALELSAFLRVAPEPVLSLICLAKNITNARPVRGAT